MAAPDFVRVAHRKFVRERLDLEPRRAHVLHPVAEAPLPRALQLRRLQLLAQQLVGRIVDVRTSGLVGQVVISIGGQHITSLITADAVREMGLKRGQTAAALIKATEVMIIKV